MILIAAGEVRGATVIRSLQPLHELAMETDNSFAAIAYARDDRYEYLATPAGLYRATRLASGALELIAFPGESVNAVAVDADGDLYVGRGLPFFAVWPQKTLLRSRDRGATFEAIGEGLHDCIVETECGYLVPDQISFAPGRLFVSAGGNVLVSTDEGANWTILLGASADGKPASQLCPVTYERLGERLLLGGECPLDFAYIRGGTLRPDLLGWAAEPRDVITPELENRNVQFIRDFGNGVVYAGVEGGLLKSTDGGISFRFVLFHPIVEETDRYPYLTHLVRSSEHPSLLVVSGFDKKNLVGYLAYSPDNGESWTDLSPLVAPSTNVAFVAEDADGRLLVGMQDEGKLKLAELVPTDAKKRRSVRR
ncbi:MAG TPA: hypothetical protein VHL59_05350 [Thermoanaerobaculia bacterium]|nr:hypothetical protein [Thermoanaerobaculia bacterium]